MSSDGWKLRDTYFGEMLSHTSLLVPGVVLMISVRHSHHDCRGTAHGHVINFVKEGREEKGHRRGWRRNCNRGWECPKKQKHKKKGQQMNMWFMTEFFVLFPFLPLLKRFGCCQNKWLYTFAPNIHCQFVCIYIYGWAIVNDIKTYKTTRVKCLNGIILISSEGGWLGKGSWPS